MLYRVTTDGRRRAVDLKDFYATSLGPAPAWLAAAGPGLRRLPLRKVRRSGLPIAAINNAMGVSRADGFELFEPDLWFSTDLPSRFTQRAWISPNVVKIAPARMAMAHVPRTDWHKTCDMPGALFYDQVPEGIGYDDWLDHGDRGGFIWWHDTMLAALAILHWLGFRRVYALGVVMTVPDVDRVYDAPMWRPAAKGRTAAEREKIEMARGKRAASNACHMADVWNRLRLLRRHFLDRGFELVSCTPKSALNALFPYVPVAEAIERERRALPEGTEGLYDVDADRGMPRAPVKVHDVAPKGRRVVHAPPTDAGASELEHRRRNVKTIKEMAPRAQEFVDRMMEMDAIKHRLLEREDEAAAKEEADGAEA